MKSTCGPRAILSRFTIKCVKYCAPNWLIASLLVLFGQSQAWEINAIMKRKDNNYVGILSDQREAAIASNLSEYTKLILGKTAIFNQCLVAILCPPGFGILTPLKLNGNKRISVT